MKMSTDKNHRPFDQNVWVNNKALRLFVFIYVSIYIYRGHSGVKGIICSISEDHVNFELR